MLVIFPGAEYVFDTKGKCKIFAIKPTADNKLPIDAMWDGDHKDDNNKTAYLLLATGMHLFSIDSTTAFYQGEVNVFSPTAFHLPFLPPAFRRVREGYVFTGVYLSTGGGGYPQPLVPGPKPASGPRSFFGGGGTPVLPLVLPNEGYPQPG